MIYFPKQVFNSLVEVTKDIQGAKVENNKFCVSVHYRNVEEKVGCFFFRGRGAKEGRGCKEL